MARFPAQILANRAVITLTGEGVLAFLHSLITADVASLPPGGAAYGALLTPQGKILHDLFVFFGEDGIHIDCARDHQDVLLQKLRMYRLRAKLAIEPSPTLAVAVSDGAPLPGLCVADPRLADIGKRAIVVARSLATNDGYDAARLELGLADSIGDIGSSEHFVHEANLDFLNGVSFTKGCYVGQEVVSRMQHRGTARARMLPVTCDGFAPARGTAIKSGETAIGTMLSSRGQIGLALIRLDRLAEATAPLLSTGVKITVQKPQWMKIAVTAPEPAQ